MTEREIDDLIKVLPFQTTASYHYGNLRKERGFCGVNTIVIYEHICVRQPVTIGRFKRLATEPLCNPAKRLPRLYSKDEIKNRSNTPCARCLLMLEELVGRQSVKLKNQPEPPVVTLAELQRHAVNRQLADEPENSLIRKLLEQDHDARILHVPLAQLVEAAQEMFVGMDDETALGIVERAALASFQTKPRKKGEADNE